MSKSKHGTSGGVELTDSLINQLAKEAERGYDIARLRPRARRGRPPLGAEASSIFQVRLDPAIRDGLAAAAEAEGISPSELTRRALRHYLQSARSDATDDPLMPVIERARSIPDAFDQLKGELGEPYIRWDDFPVSTLSKLERVARVDLRSGLTLLERPEEAYGAEIHVRTLIEFLATVAWVTGFVDFPPDFAGARQRAICLEFGLADRVRRVADSIPSRFHMGQDTHRATNQRYRALKRVHQETGCKCGGRRWYEAQNSLEQVIETSKEVIRQLGRPVDANQFEQYKHLRSTASAMSHLGLWDRVIQEVTPGINDFVPASHQYRASVLSWLTHSYGTASIWMLQLEASRRVQDMVAAINGVLGDPTLRRACEGHLDERPRRNA